MTSAVQNRRDRLTTALQQRGLAAAAVVPGPNFYYLTGINFHLMERPTLAIFTASGDILAIMPELERLKWADAFPDAVTFYWQDDAGFETAFAAASEELGIVEMGIEGQRMRAFEADCLRRHMPQGAVTDTEDLFAALRISKDSDEISAIAAAIAISETALEETLAEVRAGMSERAIQALLKTRMLAGGADFFAFEPIVLAGGHAANPHGSPGNTPVQSGDPLLIDFGAGLNGYAADITRTYFVDAVSDRHAAIYHTVEAANAKGRETASAAVSAHDLDTAVNTVLQSSPFAELIVHKTGHGLGLAVHEAPQIMQGNHQKLPLHTVITIEPGLYAPGEIGVRIEDDVLIEADTSRSLTNISRELRLIGAG